MKATRSPWIVSAPYDLVFFVGTPLLCLAAFLPFAGRVPSLSIYLAVMAFSSFGHHLPGFLRAYGERDVFRCHRWRFLLAPPLLFTAYFVLGARELSTMLFVLMAWSIWHVAMQHFGFLRIYDARVGQTSSVVARLDRALVLSWFAAVVCASPQYTHDLLANYVRIGGWLPAASTIQLARNVVFAVTGLVTVAWLVQCALLVARKQPLSPLKVLLHVVTIAFLAYVWVGLEDLVLGLAVWEVFHDVQYFAITWVHNERLVQKGLGDTSFMRFLFRGRAPLVLLYVAAIVGYGALDWWIVRGATPGTLAHAGLMAFVFTSTTLHYYYDGFLWKVRSPRTQAAFELGAGEVRESARSRSLAGGLVQFGAFALPLGALAALELAKPEDPQRDLRQRETICAVAPRAAAAQRNFAVALERVGRPAEARVALERALALDERDARAHANLGALLLQLGSEEAEARAHLARARELAPRDPLPVVNLALLEHRSGRTMEAIAHYRTALELGREADGPAELTLAGIERLAAGDLGAARLRLEEARGAGSEEGALFAALATIARAEGDPAREGEALALMPAGDARDAALVDFYLRADRGADALALLAAWNERHADDLDRKLLRAEILATHRDEELRDGPMARALAGEVVERTSRANAGALDVLGAAYAECGEFALALETAREALTRAREQGFAANAAAIEARIALYEREAAFRAPAPR